MSVRNMPKREVDSHKGDYGKVLIIAGSRGMTGAAYLSSQAALFSGSGLVTCAVPSILNDILEIKLTEVMTLPVPCTSSGGMAREAFDRIFDFSEKCDVVAIGPGLGREKDTFHLVRALVDRINKPLVIDADGLNALKGCVDVLTGRGFPTVLTPHPGEMAHLLDIDAGSVQADREKTALKCAARTGSIVVLKGHRTVVVSPEGKKYVNSTGNSGMATGGTGDVLTGMIASFIGQGIDVFSSSVNAVYLHGLSGDMALSVKGPFSLTASDILSYLPKAFREAGII